MSRMSSLFSKCSPPGINPFFEETYSKKACRRSHSPNDPSERQNETIYDSFPQRMMLQQFFCQSVFFRNKNRQLFIIDPVRAVAGLLCIIRASLGRFLRQQMCKETDMSVIRDGTPVGASVRPCHFSIRSDADIPKRKHRCRCDRNQKEFPDCLQHF